MLSALRHSQAEFSNRLNPKARRIELPHKIQRKDIARLWPQPKWRSAGRWRKSLGDEYSNFSHRQRRPAGIS
jgi:hypothetical protein